MANKYVNQIRHGHGSENIFQQMFQNPNIQAIGEGFKQKTGISTERIANISQLSEVNMQLTEDVLKKLDTTINIYNVSGALLGAASVLVIINEAKKLMNK